MGVEHREGSLPVRHSLWDGTDLPAMGWATADPRDPQVPGAHSLSLIKDENTPAASETP